MQRVTWNNYPLTFAILSWQKINRSQLNLTTRIQFYVETYYQAERQQAFVKVSRSDVDQLITEIMQVKEFLPKVDGSPVITFLSFLFLTVVGQ